MMSQAQVVYWIGFLSGTAFGTTIGMLFTAWWLHRTRVRALAPDHHGFTVSLPVNPNLASGA